MKVKLLSMIVGTFMGFGSIAQFTQDFEGTFPPTGWGTINNGSTNTWYQSVPGNGTANSGTQVARIDYDASVAHDDYLIIAQFTVTSGLTDRLSLYARNRSTSFLEQFNIVLSTTGNLATDFTTTIAAAVTPPTTWQEYTYDLAPYLNQTVYIAIQAISTNQWELYIDDISVDAMPSCFEPTALGTDITGSTTADVYWTTGGAANWNLEYGPAGFTLGSGISSNEINDTVNLTGLNPAVYEFYVRDSCAVGDVSAWVGPYRFGLNQSCANAQAITGSGTFFAAGPANGAGCFNCSSAPNAIWYEYTAPADGTIDISACAGGTDTRLWVYTGSCGTLTQVGADDDACGTITYSSELTGLTVNSGTTYYLEWDDRWNSDDFQFSVTFNPVVETAPYIQNFDNSGNMPFGWVQSAGNAEDWEFNNGSSSGHQGDNNNLGDHTIGVDGGIGYYAYVDDSSPNSLNTGLETPAIDVSALTTPQMRFWVNSNNEGETNVNLSVDFYDGAVWHDSIYGRNTNTAGWEEVIVDLSSYTITGDIKFRFVVDENNGTDFDDDIAIDDFWVLEAPTCFRPTAMAAANITSTTADISWTTGGATNWQIEHGPMGFSLGSGTKTGVTTNPHMLTGLLSGYLIDVYVRDSCSATDVSFWQGPLTIYTPCAGPISGNFTLDPSLPASATNFTSLAQIQMVLDSCGVSGPVVFDIAPGIYTENIVLADIAGASATNTITFDGGDTADVTITHFSTSDVPTIHFNGADYVTLKNITIENTSTSDAWAVMLQNGSDYITVDSCAVVVNVTSTTDVIGLVTSNSLSSDASSGNNANYLMVSNTSFYGGEMGIHLYGSSTASNVGNQIHNCTFINNYDAGMEINYQDDLTISGNTITANAAVSSTTFIGIDADDIFNFEISSNMINSTDQGMTIDDANFVSAPAANSIVANNMVRAMGDDGIYMDDAEKINFFHNTVIGDPGLYLNDVVAVDIRNNIIIGEGGFAMDAADSLGAGFTVDYNVYNSDALDMFDMGTASYTDLAAWQAAEGSRNMNSLSGNPIFISIADNLHVLGTLANNVGDATLGITEDIDGDVRSLTTPDIGADEFSPANCTPPLSSSLTVIAVYSDSATVGWAAGSGTLFNLEYGSSGYAQGAGTSITGIVDTFYTITGLTPSTIYDFYIQSDCGINGTSIWSGPVTFTTLCLKDTIPYIQDFTSGVFPICWTRSNATDVSIETTCDVRTNVLEFNNTEEAITPVIDASGVQSIQVSYYFAAGACTNDPEGTEHFHIDYWDGTQWVQAKDYDGSWPQAFVWDSFIVPQNQLSANFMVRFDMIDGTTDAWQIDSLVIEEGPTCIPPSALGATVNSSTTAEVYWTTGGASNWNVEYGPGGFTPGTGTIINATNDTASITGLTASTTYEFYVRDSCGMNDVSIWVGPFSFTTACGTFSTPHTESFNTTSIPNCWSVYSSTTENWTFGSNTYAPSSDHTGTGEYATVDDSESPASPDLTLESPLFDVSTLTNPSLSFFLASEDATVTLTVDVWDGTIWHTGIFTHAAPTVNTWDSIYVNLTPYSSGGTVAVRFVANEDNGGFQNDLAIDDITISSGPSCPPPSNLGATSNSGTTADIYWTSGGASNWDVEYGPGGFTPGTGTMINASNDTLQITGLITNLAYEFYVRDSCAIGDVSSWVGPFSFGSQTVPCDNFDAYTTGLVDPQSSLINGWAGSGGDAEISTTYTSSAPNSLKIHDSGTNGFSDVVAEVGTFNSGTHKVAFDFYIPSGNGGYYNILHNYTGSGTNTWAIEVLLDMNGTATVDEGTNGSGSIGTYSFNLGAWNTVEHIIDLDNDTAYIIINGVTTSVGWQFSLGSTNFGDQFNAANFYSSAPTGQTPLMYFDDFCITPVIPSGGGCAPFAATITNDTICAPGVTNFTSNPAGNIVVYLDPLTNMITGAGDTLHIQNNNDTTLSLREAIPAANGGHVGPLSNIATTGFGNFTNGQWISVLDTISIDSMTVQANGIVEAHLQVFTNDPALGGTLVQLGKPFVTGSTTGDYQVPVGVVLMPGSYFINVDFTGGAGQLFRATSGAVYPYVLAGLMSIDSTNFTSQTRLYYTFDLVVNEVCLSDPITVTSYIQGLSAGDDQALALCDNGAIEDLSSYLSADADAGGTFVSTNASAAISGNNFNPAVLTAGSYQVYYTTTSTPECPADSALFEIDIQACLSCAGMTPPVLTSDTICGPGVVNLGAAISATDVVWYDQANEIVGYGDTLSVNIAVSTPFTASSVLSAGPTITAGPPQNMSSNVYPAANFTNGQYISVAQDVRIDSAVFAVNGALDFVVAIQDAQKTDTLQVSSLISFAGADTAASEIGLYLAPGTYFISVIPISGTGVMWRPTAGANFPYGVQNILSVDSSDFGPTRLYYLYDMKVSAACISAVDSVYGIIAAPANAGLDANDSICDSAAVVDLTTFLGAGFTTGGTWVDVNSSGGLTGSVFDPSAVIEGQTYEFLYYVSSADCGSDSATVVLYVRDCKVGLEEYTRGTLEVYPNPTRNKVVVEAKLSGSKMLTIEVYSMNGQLMMKSPVEGFKTEIDLEGLADGLYNLKVTSEEGIEVHRISKE